MKLRNLILLTIVFRLPSLAIPFWNKDEGWNAARAVTQAAGGRFYIDAYDHKTPLLYYMHGWVFSLFSGEWRMFVVRCLYIAAIVGTGLGIYVIARQLAGRRAGLLAFFLFSVFQMCWIAEETYYAGTENFMNLALAWAVALFMYGRCASDFFAGTFLALGLLFRNSALPDVFVMFAFVVVDFFSHRSVQVVLKRIGTIFAGLVVPLAIVYAYLAKSGTLDPAIFWNLDFVKLFLMNQPPLADVLQRAFTKTGMVVAAQALLYALAFIGIYRIFRNGRQVFGANLRKLYPIFWLAGGVSVIFAGGRFSTHYYFQLLPALSVLAGMELDRAWEWWRVKSSRKWLLKIAIFLPLAGFFMEVPYRIGEYYGLIGRPSLTKVTSAYIRSHTKPYDRIFVWGYLPQIYYEAGRVSSSRFHTVTHLTGQIREESEYDLSLPQMKRLWAYFWEDMKSHPPVLFIDGSKAFPVSGRYMHGPEKFPELRRWLEANYSREAELDTTIIYRRRGQNPQDASR